jgi:hypothetical protein
MIKKLLLVCAFVGVPAAALASDVVATGIGPRVGFSSGPDQLLLGGQMVVGGITPEITFDPSIDLGFGDHQTVVGFNFDLHYHFDTNTRWRPYAGAGVVLSFVSFDEGFFGRNRGSDTFAGGNVVVGAGTPTASGNRFFSELKLGIGDVTDLKLVAGWNFKL